MFENEQSQIERDPPDNDPKLLNSQYDNRIERDPPDNDPKLLNSQYDNKLHLTGQKLNPNSSCARKNLQTTDASRIDKSNYYSL